MNCLNALPKGELVGYGKRGMGLNTWSESMSFFCMTWELEREEALSQLDFGMAWSSRLLLGIKISLFDKSQFEGILLSGLYYELSELLCS